VRASASRKSFGTTIRPAESIDASIWGYASTHFPIL